jgi:PIN domain nuclease of toxin-antitoxin system
MRLLLDTHAFLWWVEDNPRLSRKAGAAVVERGNDCYLSLASSWEMAIKISLGKLKLKGSLERFIPDQLAANGFRELPIDFGHVTRVSRLPFHHRDPFDRLLVAQALEEELTIVSANRVFGAYRVKRIW